MSVPTNVVDRIPLVAATRAQLKTAMPETGAAATAGFLSEATDVPLLADKTHVQRYWVLHPWGGVDGVEPDLADINVELAWGFQLTLVAPFRLDVLDMVTRATAALYRWQPVIDGYECGRLKPPPGYDPGPVRVDEDFNPHRYWLPLQYQTAITRAS